MRRDMRLPGSWMPATQPGSRSWVERTYSSSLMFRAVTIGQIIAVWDCPDSVDRLTTLPSATSVLGAHTPLG